MASSARKGLITLVMGAAAACGGGDSALVDPDGTWTTTLTYGVGDCGVNGVQQEIWTVTKSAEGYAVSGSDPSQGFSGTITCDSSKCKFSGQWTGTGTAEDGTEFSGNAAVNANVDKSGKVAGSGSLSVTQADGTTCTQAFSLAGTKS